LGHLCFFGRREKARSKNRPIRVSADPVVLELAGLLRAGVSAFEAKAALENRLSAMPELQKLQFDIIWSLVSQSGGSIAEVMQNLSDSFKSAERHVREIELAFAGPKSTARLVSLLPIAALGLAQCFGLNPVAAIFTKPLAFISVALGVILMILGRLWTKSILQKARFAKVDPGLFIDSVRFGLSGGLPFARAIEQSVAEFENRLPAAIAADVEDERGASLSALLESAAQVRREVQRHAEATAVAKLSIKLMVPLGLLTLPAFILCAIAPMAIGLLSTRQG
jgi:tight adherence protein B